MFETALRELLAAAFKHAPDAAWQERFLAKQREHGTHGKQIEELSLDRLVGMAHEMHVIDNLAEGAIPGARKIKRVVWTVVIELRDTAAHNVEHASIGRGDALQMRQWLEEFLLGTGLAQPAPEDEGVCPDCQAAVEREWTYCPGCSTRLRAPCENCGALLGRETQLCPKCNRVQHGARAAGPEEKEYDLLCRGVYLDQVASPGERRVLEENRRRLKLTVEQAEAIEARHVAPNVREYQNLLEAAAFDGEISAVERAQLEKRRKELKLDAKLAREIEAAVMQCREAKRKSAQRPRSSRRS